MRLEPRQLRLKTRRETPKQWVHRESPCTVLACLELFPVDDRRPLIASALRDDPKIVAVCRCCDDAVELIKRLEDIGITEPPPRLGNKDIVMLRPSAAEYLSFVETYHATSSESPESFVKRVLGYEDEQLRGVSIELPEKFHVQRLMVGLVWEKADE